ncbi:FUSC family protein [Burkholderia sp. Ac-20379]|uniref:FUSC family protein n=1 Tax=Burkholderia sp. Ac-20379 TaxID=2703900 RepID=UPI00197DF3D2|nr:FUSC family protein [Burkholderia sp. Ac-20379]MBN3725336.1 FUSC family protein [Burkholderia sp. Ac-20379]
MDTIRTLHDTRRQIQQSIASLFKGMSLRERTKQGAAMALQAVCGACLAYGIGRLLHSEQAVWAAVTAISVTQHQYSDTMSLSRDQFIGAMVGGVLGFAGAALGNAHYTTHLLAYAVAIGATIVICWCLDVGSAARLGGVTATTVLLFPGDGPLWDIPLIRLGMITLGTVCALVVCALQARIERWWWPAASPGAGDAGAPPPPPGKPGGPPSTH